MADKGRAPVTRAEMKRMSKRELIRFNLALQDRILALEERLGLSSANSSQPPSSDRPDREGDRKKKKKKKKKKTSRRQGKSSGRKAGGQPGHPKHDRPLVPEEDVDHLERILPDACSGCGGGLMPTKDPPLRHQVVDLPESIELPVTEYQLQAGYCPCCDETTRAELPAGVPTSAFGPRLHAMVAFLSTTLRLSDRQVQEAMFGLYNLQMALGSVAKIRMRMSEAVAESVEEAQAQVAHEAVVHADETSWREMGLKAWLWTFATATMTVFLIRPFRSKAVAQELLGEDFPGTLITDRYGAYAWALWRQICWAHLKRDFERIAGRHGRAGEVGRRLKNLGEQLFETLGKFRDGVIQPSTFESYVSRHRAAIRRALIDGTTCGHAKTEGTCKEILKVETHLWTFTREEGVEPTNNRAERSLRHGVIWRKTRLGTQSLAGSDYVERMLTVVTTLKQQGRDVLGYLTAAIDAQLHGRSAPSLLPAS